MDAALTLKQKCNISEKRMKLRRRGTAKVLLFTLIGVTVRLFVDKAAGGAAGSALVRCWSQ